MTDDHTDRILADCLEDYHRQRARGEVPDMAAFRVQLGDLVGEFLDLVAAETAIDAALEPGGDAPLPLAWGKYTILREIARGAAGVVYEALHRELGRKVALKVLRTGLDTDEVTRERFRREAQALAQVHHDHIVEIYEFGELDGRPYYAMSLVQGPTLADLVKHDKLPEPRTLCRGLAGIANALQTLHEAGMIHRDVKPSNIMIAPNGRYMLADYGLARTAMSATVTRTGDALGTPLYMSPEQILGNRDAIESRTDIYGLGATMYQMLTGKPPFKTENLHALMRMVLSQRPEPARTVNPDLPAGCSRIAMKCLEKEPRDRYPSAGELEADLLAFADGRTVSGKPLGLWQRAARQVRRHPAYAAMAAVVLGLAVWLAVRVPPTYVSVEPRLEARVQIEGIQGDLPTPVRRHLLPGPGHYELVVTPLDGEYKPQRAGFDVVAGDHVPVALQPFEPKDPSKAADALSIEGVQAPEFQGVTRSRGTGGDSAIELWFPRGKVTAAEARNWVAHIGMDFPKGGGVLEFRADGKVLGRVGCPEPGDDDSWKKTGQLDDEITKQLKSGAQITWQFLDHQGKAMGLPATFEIAEFDREGAFAALDERLEPMIKGWESDDAKEIARTTLRAQTLMKAGLDSEACVLLLPLLEDKRGGQLQIALYKAALENLMRADKQTRRTYQDWKIWQDVQDYYDRYDAQAWDTFLKARTSSK